MIQIQLAHQKLGIDKIIERRNASHRIVMIRYEGTADTQQIRSRYANTNPIKLLGLLQVREHHDCQGFGTVTIDRK
jgi:hypothetical protein